MQKTWVYKNIDEDVACKLAEKAGISLILAKVFVSRGMTSAELVKDFLDSELAGLHDPFLMADMKIAVERIIKATASGEEILVYGDYDVDGVAGASILYNFLVSRGARVRYFFPDRMEDGYGMAASAASKVKSLGASLVITVDCGITSIEEIRMLQSTGMQVIVTDHHECGELLPDAYAVLNPRKPCCCYPFKELAGAGVALKLVQGICIRTGSPDEYLRYIDLAALATIADVVPLTGENRIIARHGLKAMETTQNTGLAELVKVSGLAGKPITSYAVAYIIAPRINAAGRLGDAARSARLFTEDNKMLAEALAKELDEENRNRQKTEEQIIEEAVGLIESDPRTAGQKVFVIAGTSWHHGVIGIVSSKITERYGKPSIVISVENGIGKGSGRSIKGFSLFKALSICGDLLERFGGHEMAAGLTIKEEKINEFRKRINDFADSVLSGEKLAPALRIDAFVELAEITPESVRQLDKLAPFGESNPIPHFGCIALSVLETRTLKGGRHLKLRLGRAGRRIDAIGFSMGEFANMCKEGDAVDVVFIPEINVWNGRESLQFNIKDIKPCIFDELDKNIVIDESNDYNINVDPLKSCNLLRFRGIRPSELVPGRKEIEAVYRYLKACCKQGGGWAELADLLELCDKISMNAGLKINYFKLKKTLEIFHELKLLTLEKMGRKSASVRLANGAGRVELETSRILCALRDVENFFYHEYKGDPERKMTGELI